MYFVKITLDIFVFWFENKMEDNVDEDKKTICPLAEDPQHV